MKDLRLVTLAKNLVNYCVELKKGDKLYLEVRGKDTLNLAKEVITQATLVGATPVFIYSDSSLTRRFLLSCDEDQINALADMHLGLMKQVQAYIGIRGDDNCFDLSDISPDKMSLYNKNYVNKVHIEQRVKNTRWCILRYPNASMATLAEKSQETFEDFYFKVCNLNYAKLSKAMDSLKNLMQRTDKVRIISKGTDINFSIKNIPVIKCDGKLNIPDGEVFTAPVKDSVNGVIQYNTPSLHDSYLFRNVRLEFKNGKIISASCEGDNDKLNKTFDIDEGARYVGEFAIGVNPHIHHAMKDILFDEKIWGSIHLTPGASYDEAFNGNKSALHWDLVLIQTPEYGGGEIYFDDVLIRKDGEFVHPELKALKREELIKED